MAEWSFLTNHGRALLCVARDSGARLRDIADELGITERRAYSIITELAEAGYLVIEKDGRRNRYTIRTELPLHDAVIRERTVGELLDLLVGQPAPEEAESGALPSPGAPLSL